MYFTRFIIIIIQSTCIGMDWCRKLQSSWIFIWHAVQIDTL